MSEDLIQWVQVLTGLSGSLGIVGVILRIMLPHLAKARLANAEAAKTNAEARKTDAEARLMAAEARKVEAESIVIKDTLLAGMLDRLDKAVEDASEAKAEAASAREEVRACQQHHQEALEEIAKLRTDMRKHATPQPFPRVDPNQKE